MCASFSLSEITCKWSLIKNMFWCFYSIEGGDQALVDLLVRLFKEIYPQWTSVFQLLLWWLTFPCALAEGHLLCQQAGDGMLKLFWCLSCWFWQYCSFHLLPSFSSCLCWMRNALFPCPAVYEGRTNFFCFYPISSFTENVFAVWLGRRNEDFFFLLEASLQQKLVISCIWLWKTVPWNIRCLQVWLRATGVNHWFPSDADAALVCWFWQLFLLASIPQVSSAHGAKLWLHKMRRWPCSCSVLLKLL